MPETVLFVLLWLLPALYLSVIIHEAGHVVAGLAVGAVPTSFGAGLGKIFFRAKLGEVRFFLGARNPFQGITFCLWPEFAPGRWQNVCLLAGGVTANAVASSWFLWLAQIRPGYSTLCFTIAAVNGYLAIVNLIPLEAKLGSTTLHSDGSRILGCFFLSQEVAEAQFLKTHRALTPLWDAVGDARTSNAHTVLVAAIWTQLGDAHYALELLDAAHCTPAFLPADLAYAGYVRGEALSMIKQTQHAEVELTKAATALAKFRAPVASYVALSARAQILQLRGEKQALADLYDEMTMHPLARRSPRTTAYRRLIARLLRIEDADGSQTNVLVAEYEALPAKLRSPFESLQMYRSLIDDLRPKDDPAALAVFYRPALVAISAIDAMLTGADRPRFRNAQSALIAEAEACFRRIGSIEEADRLAAFFLQQDGKSRQIDKKTLERQRRAKQAARSLTLTNFRMGLFIFGVGMASFAVINLVVPFTVDSKKLLKSPPVLQIAALATLLLIFGTLSLIATGSIRLINWLRGEPTATSGQPALILGYAPWLLWIAVELLILGIYIIDRR